MTLSRIRRVAMFSSEYLPGWGGLASHVSALIEEMNDFVPTSLFTVSSNNHLPTNVHNLAVFRSRNFVSLSSQYMFFGSVVSRLLTHSYDIYHLHVPQCIMIPNGIPVVTTFHIVWPAYAKSMRDVARLSTFDFPANSLGGRLPGIAEMYAIKKSRLIICLSNYVAQALRALYHVESSKIRIIPNGIDTDDFLPDENKQPYFLFVGRQTAHKGLESLLRAFAMIASRIPQYKLVIVGERLEGGISPYLVSLAAKLGIKDRILFTGHIAKPALVELYSKAYGVVLPSLQEAFGSVLLEAMASKTPVIASAVGGIMDVVRDGENGVLVPPNSPEDLANAMYSLVAEKIAHKRMMNFCQGFVRKYDWRNIAMKTYNVYQEAVFQDAS